MIKRIIAIVLTCSLILTACGSNATNTNSNTGSTNTVSNYEEDASESTTSEAVATSSSETSASEYSEAGASESSPAGVAETSYEIPDVSTDVEFANLNTPELLPYFEDAVYSELIDNLDSDQYYVEDVSAVYVSQEYLQEAEYNSKENIYYGYSLSDLENQFKGEKYVFTLGDDGTTVVTEFEDYDDTYDRIIKNVTIGSGVIIICVTVSVVTAGAGAPAISMVFVAAAKTGTLFALSSGVISGVAAGAVTAYQTNDFAASVKAAALAGSESFKWGAITGALIGGAQEAVGLQAATTNGLTINEAAKIQKESKYPLDVIKQFKSMDEYEVYKNAGLKVGMIDGKTALIRNIDLDYKSELNGKTVTNLERMAKGYAPLDPKTGLPYQLHHINQANNGTLAILNESEHQGNSVILNIAEKKSEIGRVEFATTRKAFWKSFAELASK